MERTNGPHFEPLPKRPKFFIRKNFNEGQDDLRRRALEEMGLDAHSLTSTPSSQMTSRTEPWQLVADGVPYALSGSQSLLVNTSTQTDEWRDLTCENCGIEFKEDDDSVLCSTCAFWTHYKCIKRQVFDGESAEGAERCTFCFALEQRMEKCEIEMNNQVKMIETAETAADVTENDPDAPKGSSEKWQYYWNIIRPSDGRNFKVGDYVYIPDDEKQVVVIWLIDFLFRDTQKHLFAIVSELCFPENIMRNPNQKFYANEVYLMTAEQRAGTCSTSYTRLESIKGPAIAILKVSEYRKYIPRCIPRAHVYIERNYYDRSCKNPLKYSTKPAKPCDFKTCTNNFALRPLDPPLDSTKHKERKFEEIDWVRVRIQPKDLT